MKRTARARGGLSPDKYLSDAQRKRLLDYVRQAADAARQRGSSRAVVDEMIVFLLDGTGLRASELCDLNLADLPTHHGKGTIWVRDGKGNVSRTVDVSDKLKDRLKRYIRLYRKDAEPDEPLLISERGSRMAYRSIYSKITRIGQQAGIKNLHPHTIRHTYLTRLYNIERDLRFVQDQAGHADPKTTAIYAKTNNKARRRQVEAMEND